MASPRLTAIVDDRNFEFEQRLMTVGAHELQIHAVEIEIASARYMAAIAAQRRMKARRSNCAFGQSHIVNSKKGRRPCERRREFVSGP
jgi:hypothetical protein